MTGRDSTPPRRPTSSTPPPAAPPDPSAPLSNADLVRAALNQQVVDKQQTAEAIAKAKRAGPLKTLGLILGITAVFLAFSYGVSSVKRGDPPERTPDRIEAELKYGAYLAAQRVDQYIGVVGRLPANNADLGYGEGWLTYTRGTEGDWQITAREGDISVTLRSDDDRRRWLGEAGQRVVSGK
jgi:hypothetical protein